MKPAGFDGDERKWLLSLETHGTDFRPAIALFDHPHLTAETIRNDESRLVSLGRVARCVIAVVWTDRTGIVRIIPARAARRKEKSLDDAFRRMSAAPA